MSQATRYTKDKPPTLPPGWIAVWDEQYQTFYYVNKITNESTWEPPTSAAVAPPNYEQPTSPKVQSQNTQGHQIYNVQQQQQQQHVQQQVQHQQYQQTYTGNNFQQERPVSTQSDTRSGMGTAGGVAAGALGGFLLSGMLRGGRQNRNRPPPPPMGFGGFGGPRRRGRC